jgi:pimeloyl-ACP methyl ester carboxylesterase
MDIILLAGLWLPASVWDPVVVELEARGHRPRPLQLPGVDDGSTTATLDDQLAAALGAVDAADRPMVIGHSAASTLAWLAADRRPADVSAAVFIGGFPGVNGARYAAFFDTVDGVMPFPGWGPFEGPDSADLDDASRERIESMAVAVPEAVSHAQVELTDERRFDVPVVLICPEFSPDDARGWIEAGDIPELQRARHVSFVDIDSGHWPMVTRPGELAAIISGLAA